jgi:hypothetical protein
VPAPVAHPHAITIRRHTAPGTPLRSVPFAVSLVAAALVVTIVATPTPAWLAGIVAVALAVGFSAEVRVPQGGEVSLGDAGVIALVCLGAARDSMAIVLAAVVLAAWPTARSEGRKGVWRLGSVVVGLVVALAAGAVVRHLLESRAPVSPRLLLLAPSVAAGVAYIAVLGCGVSVSVFNLRARGVSRLTIGMYVSLLCGALFLVEAAHQSVWLGLVASIPLIMVRTSVNQYAEARLTYAQAALALAVLPEAAGRVPVGHADRTAVFAGAICDHLGADAATREAVERVALLHHVGEVVLPDPRDTSELPDESPGEAGARLVGRVKELAEVARQLAGVHSPRGPRTDIESIVAVASDFDDAVRGGSTALHAVDLLRERFPVGVPASALDALAEIGDRAVAEADRVSGTTALDRLVSRRGAAVMAPGPWAPTAR